MGKVHKISVKKKIGRPTDNPRKKRLSPGIAENEMGNIDYCAQKLNLSKIETILLAVNLLKDKLESSYR